ncbi:kynurenine formamidase [[Candida] railenensis]|uniref:Kynurenine formamidase n=1 Tax=[Candida] railenensis TaxID=45579 RepID=A0A9P0QP76_9ASCO|nr:kynurenine formamidase [[Candida] railenensis]
MTESFGSDPLQTVKVFRYDEANNVGVIFIHGGAWRDPNNTYDDFKEFASYAEANYPSLNLFGVNYRLSPNVKHPGHLQDISESVEYLKKTYDLTDIVLVGHSVGATLILQYIRRTEAAEGVRISNCYLIDGIFDIPELVSEYPGYASFVNEAFTSEKQYSEATDIYDARFSGIGHIYIIQSLQDELLSERQTDLLAGYLANTSTKFLVQKGNWGLHEEVYRRKEVFDLVLGTIGTAP